MNRADTVGTGRPAFPSATARLLGVAGLLPFVAGAVASWTVPVDSRPGIAGAMTAYGATIVAFLGGLHWGLAAHGRGAAAQYAWGVVPALLGWTALLLGDRAGLALIAGTLVACYLVDRRVLGSQGLAGWLPLRALLTSVATASCVAGAFATA